MKHLKHFFHQTHAIHSWSTDWMSTSWLTPLVMAMLFLAKTAQAVPPALLMDTASPRIRLLSPTSDKLSELTPLKITGQIHDNESLAWMEVSLNGQPVSHEHTPTDSTNRTWKFNASIQALNGSNTLSISARDSAGNTRQHTHQFHFEPRHFLTVTQLNYADFTSPESAGTVTVTGSKPDDVRPITLKSVPGFSIKAGARIRLTATAHRGYQFDYWAYEGFTPLNSESLFREMHLIMPERDIWGIAAYFSANEWLAKTEDAFNFVPEQSSNTLHFSGILSPITPDRLNTGICDLTLNRRTGIFSGRIQLGDLGRAAFAGEKGHSFEPFWIKTRSGFQNHLLYKGRKVTLEFSEPNLIYATVVSEGTLVCEGILSCPIYSSDHPVPEDMLVPEPWFDDAHPRGGRSKPGYYTGFINVGARNVYHPRGTGFVAATLSKSGRVRFAGTLPTGTNFLASGDIRSGNFFYDGQVGFHTVLPKARGHATQDLLTGALGLWGGSLSVDARWFRSAAAKPDVADYPSGWPESLGVVGDGRLYDTSPPLQLMFGAYDSDPIEGNMSVLIGPSLDTYYFDVNRNAVRLLPDSPRGFSIQFDRPTGRFQGTFINEQDSRPARRTFQGIIVNGLGGGFYYYKAPDKHTANSGWIEVGS